MKSESSGIRHIPPHLKENQGLSFPNIKHEFCIPKHSIPPKPYGLTVSSIQCHFLANVYQDVSHCCPFGAVKCVQHILTLSHIPELLK